MIYILSFLTHKNNAQISHLSRLLVTSLIYIYMHHVFFPPFCFCNEKKSFGEYTKMLDCLYLNINNVSYMDPSFDRCAAALEWLSSADEFGIPQQLLYVPCTSAALHLLCRVEKMPELTYTTRELVDIRYQQEANLGLTQKFSEGLSAQSYRGSRTATALVKEMVPYALWMLSAGEGSQALSRPVSSVDILNTREHESFVKHVETLRSLGLTYVATAAREDVGSISANGNDNVKTMILEPPIHRLIHYQHLGKKMGSYSTPARKQIPSSVSVNAGVCIGLKTIHVFPFQSSQTQTKYISLFSYGCPR